MLKKIANELMVRVIMLLMLASEVIPNYRWERFNRKLNMARDPNTPVRKLDVLARDWDGGIRCAVASNPSAPPALLEKMLRKIGDDSFYGYNLRLNIAGNPSTPTSLLETFADDRDERVRQAAALNLSSRGDA